MAKHKSRKSVPEIPLIGDVDEWEADTVKSLLDIPEGGECTFYMDSGGGSVYGAIAIATLIQMRRLKATVIVLGECSSAAVLIFGVCQRRLVTPYSTFLFHRMRWQSEKRVGAEEAGQWARHFEQLETDLDTMQARLLGSARERLAAWIRDGRYLTGKEIAAAGLAELIEM
jgi:ATP-dependent protease ClpP protease subunit